MSNSLRETVEGPALGDWLDRLAHQKRTALWVIAALGVGFLVVAIFAPLVGLLLLAFLLLGGVAVVLYRPRAVRGLGRNHPERGQRR